MDICCQRRFLRQLEESESNLPCYQESKEFDEFSLWFREEVWKYYEMNRPTQLGNAGELLARIDTSLESEEKIFFELVKLLERLIY